MLKSEYVGDNDDCSLNVRKLTEVCKIGNEKHIQENVLSYSSFFY